MTVGIPRGISSYRSAACGELDVHAGFLKRLQGEGGAIMARTDLFLVLPQYIGRAGLN